jgi:hypothetical protein
MDHWGGDEGKCVLHLHEQVDRHQVVRPSRDDHVGPLFRLHVEPTPPQQRAHISCNLDKGEERRGRRPNRRDVFLKGRLHELLVLPQHAHDVTSSVIDVSDDYERAIKQARVSPCVKVEL